MHPTYDRIRLIASLAHHIPDAALTLSRADQRALSVGSAGDVDLDTCTFRQMLIAGENRRKCQISRPSNESARVEHIDVGGSLEVTCGDLFRTVDRGQEQRWFATSLESRVVNRLLEELDCEPEIADGVTATLKPDPALGVTTVCIAVDDPTVEDQIDELAFAAYERCMVEELVAAVASTSAEPSDGPDRGAAR